MELPYHHVAVFTLLLPLALALATAAASANTDFDFFFHVQLWPASHCSAWDADDCCYVPVNDKPPADFAISGFWPYYASCRGDRGSITPGDGPICSPGFCNFTNSFDPSLIRDLRRGLRANWASLSCGESRNNPTALWSDEWTQHGTCSSMDQHSYFLAALDFKARFNLTRILLDAGIVPSNEITYERSSIRDAITEATGSAPVVGCNRNEQGEMQLYRVYQCVGVDGRTPVHCPRLPQEEEEDESTIECADMIKFPEFPQDDPPDYDDHQ